jgi:hypothetical protein
MTSLFLRIMRKCNFKAAMGWCLGLQPAPEWVKPYGSRGHGPAPVEDRHTAMDQCALGR